MNELQQKVADFIRNIPELAHGVGTKDKPCSIAAMNLALTGELTDAIPECASAVIGKWVIRVQDACPADIGRDNPVWRCALPLLAGTGKNPAHEKERLALIMSWMWESLKFYQPHADKRGYGPEWARMCEEKTRESAQVAKKAAAYAAEAAAVAAEAAAVAAYDYADAYAAAADAYAAAAAVAAYAYAYAEAERRKFWLNANPAALLEKLVMIGAD